MTRRARQWTGLAGLLAAVVILGAYPGLHRWNILRQTPLLDGSTVTVVPGIHLLGNLGPSAAYAVESSEGLILFDTGLDGDARLLISEMSRLALDWTKTRAVFLTHVHGDHSGGAERIRTESGAQVYAGRGDVPILEAGAPQVAFFSIFRMPDHVPHPTTIDVSLRGGESIVVGDVRVQVLQTPGHTPGSICYLVERAGLRVLFSGDVIMRLGPQPLGTYSAYLAPRYRGDAKDFLGSLKMLQSLPVPDLVLPGHPRSSSAPQDPRLSQTAWNTMLADGIHDMELLVSRIEADGAAFLDGEPKRLAPDVYYFGDFQGSAVYGFFASSKFFVVDAPGGAGLAQFLTTALVHLGLQPVEPTAILLTECGEAATAGLAEMVARTHAQVVAAPAGLEVVRQLCPPGTMVISADELSRQNWFNGVPIRLSGRGLAPTAYLLHGKNGKTLLFSGRIPAASDRTSLAALLSELGPSKNDVLNYLASLRDLARLHPNLWLPAVPVNGQNAILYDSSWKDVLETNHQAASRLLQ